MGIKVSLFCFKVNIGIEIFGYRLSLFFIIIDNFDNDFVYKVYNIFDFCFVFFV